jgi:hypothetical protein
MPADLAAGREIEAFQQLISDWEIRQTVIQQAFG